MFITKDQSEPKGEDIFITSTSTIIPILLSGNIKTIPLANSTTVVLSNDTSPQINIKEGQNDQVEAIRRSYCIRNPSQKFLKRKLSVLLKRKSRPKYMC